MTASLFSQTVIAVIWDFDETLIPGNMQKPLFEHFGIDEERFWQEVRELPDRYASQGIRVSPDTLYLNHILTHVRQGQFKDLSNELLRELGDRLEFFPGLPDFLLDVKRVVEDDAQFQMLGIEVEHYIVSTGLRQMILGSKIKDHVRDVWGCEFIEELADPDYLPAQREMPVGGPQKSRPTKRKKMPRVGQPVVSQVGYVLDNTTKTRAVFEINKGTNVEPSIDVNARIRQEDRRVPFQNMIYIADGPSDIPVFSIVNQYGGKTFAVYPAGSEEHFAKVYDLQKQERIQGYGEAVYEKGSLVYLWVTHSVAEMARRIASEHQAAVDERVDAPPGRVVRQPQSSSDHVEEPRRADEESGTGEFEGEKSHG